jgi:hypothetical protein
MYLVSLDERLLAEAIEGNVNVCKKLLSQGASVQAKDERGSTPLHFAANNESRELCALFVEAGAVVDAPDNFGVTPLGTVRDYAPFVYLVEQGADPFAVYASYGGEESPLHAVIRMATPDGFNDDCEIFKYCCEKYGREAVFTHVHHSGKTLEQLAKDHRELAALIRGEERVYQAELTGRSVDSIESAVGGEVPQVARETRSQSYSPL